MDRRKYQCVERVSARPVRVVENEYVTGLHSLGSEKFDRVFNADVIAPREDCDAWRISNHVTTRVVDPDAVVVNFIHNGVVRGTTQIAGGLFCRCKKPMPNDLCRNCVSHVPPPSELT